ncbi:MAG: hypothetical protein R3F20_06460 [Planctomycetota bacterium]
MKARDYLEAFRSDHLEPGLADRGFRREAKGRWVRRTDADRFEQFVDQSRTGPDYGTLEYWSGIGWISVGKALKSLAARAGLDDLRVAPKRDLLLGAHLGMLSPGERPAAFPFRVEDNPTELVGRVLVAMDDCIREVFAAHPSIESVLGLLTRDLGRRAAGTGSHRRDLDAAAGYVALGLPDQARDFVRDLARNHRRNRSAPSLRQADRLDALRAAL